ncbi:Hypothetical_protein [Hexamita inflata]|uniref:Hypothetical_protein n=1 Tax=Hexamita inflata TaxID=28002 RepID=A0AA86QD93_9EUKA|nr:Hypothetical protein HINF_LOCUS40373 [Hexamita inflata]
MQRLQSNLSASMNIFSVNDSQTNIDAEKELLFKIKRVVKMSQFLEPELPNELDESDLYLDSLIVQHENHQQIIQKKTRKQLNPVKLIKRSKQPSAPEPELKIEVKNNEDTNGQKEIDLDNDEKDENITYRKENEIIEVKRGSSQRRGSERIQSHRTPPMCKETKLKLTGQQIQTKNEQKLKEIIFQAVLIESESESVSKESTQIASPKKSSPNLIEKRKNNNAQKLDLKIFGIGQ